MTTPIKSLANYNEKMRKSLVDKLFLVDKVDADIFVDIGCADGTLIQAMNTLFPEKHYIGYDKDRKMIQMAAKTFNDECGPDIYRFQVTKNILFISEHINEMKMEIDSLQKRSMEKDKKVLKVCIILSSVIHEVYSYDESHVNEFWRMIWSLNAEYVAIRDMCVSASTSRPADPISVARVRQLQDPQKIQQWEAQWGSLDENWSLTNFLLHYKYEENWSRELKENYLPLNKERLLALIPGNYFPHFIEHFTLPYIRQQVWNDFGIQLHDFTHIKLILRKL